MLAQQPRSMTRGFLSTLFLIMVTCGQSEQTTTTPDVTLSSSAVTTDSWKGSLIKGVHRPCDKGNETFCWNNGVCVVPQDSNVTSCICPPNFSGLRCIYAIDLLTTRSFVLEKFIALVVVMVLTVIVLCIFMYCVHTRLRKSSKLHLPEAAV